MPQSICGLWEGEREMRGGTDEVTSYSFKINVCLYSGKGKHPDCHGDEVSFLQEKEIFTSRKKKRFFFWKP